MFLGIDVSTYFDEVGIGAKYYRNHKEVDPLKLFRDESHVKYMRIRLWNDPYDENGHPYLGGTNDLKKALMLCKLAKDYGYEIIFDFHYSDFWADPGKQYAPKAWQNYTFEEVEQALYQFTLDTLNTIKKEGYDIPYCQIGNEITNGMCWPFGKLEGDFPRQGYDKLSRLLSAGIKALKEVYPNSKSIIHLEKSYDQVTYKEYFENIIKYGVDFDVIGMSYYPYWHGTFDQLFNNIDMLKKTFKKDIMIVETGYGFTVEDYIKEGSQAKLLFHEPYINYLNQPLPFMQDREGQKMFVKTLLEKAKNAGVIGVCYWEPLWLPGPGMCWSSKASENYIHQVVDSERNEWANQCLFDYEGNMTPAFEVFKV